MLKKSVTSVFALVLAMVLTFFTIPVSAAGTTRVTVYLRNDNQPVQYDKNADNTDAYFLVTQGYITVAEEYYDTDGVDDRLVRRPSVLIPENMPEGTKVLWYEIVNDGGEWRLHGVFVTEEKQPEPEPDPEQPDESNLITLGIVTPQKMSVRFEDGKIYKNGDSLQIEVGKTYLFQMCSNNWTNDTYDDDGNGLCGTVVYRVRVSDRYDERSYDESTKTFVLPKGDPVLRTDVNKCFMAYRFHFKDGDYNKQTGVEQVVDPALESLSVNLPLGSTITVDAYRNLNWIDTANVFIERDEDVTISYTDYYWEH